MVDLICENQPTNKEFHILCPTLKKKCEFAIVEEYGFYCMYSSKYLRDLVYCENIDFMIGEVKK